MRLSLTVVLVAFSVCESAAQQASQKSETNAGPIATLPFARDAGAAIFLSVRLNGGNARWWALDTEVPGVASDVGIVGNRIWSRFICIFDYRHQRLFLEPR